MAIRYPDDFRERAREMRRAGMSTSRIAYELGVRSQSVVHRWVADIPPAAWTRRPNAKDALRQEARAKRLAGCSLKEIARELGVATSSVSLWVRDLPVPPGLRERASHAHRINSERWRRERARREADRRAVKASAAARVGEVSARELLLMGAVLYWAEGAKDKPYDRREHITIINSDANVLRMFARWLDLMEVPEDDRGYRLSIHENADLEAAHAFWAATIGIPRSKFSRPTLKTHQPQTIRLNVGPDYHGCLVISVRKSRVLYQQVEGIWFGLLAGVTGDDTVVRGWTD